MTSKKYTTWGEYFKDLRHVSIIDIGSIKAFPDMDSPYEPVSSDSGKPTFIWDEECDKKKSKPRRSTIHCEKVRKVAVKLWQEDPTITIAEMAHRDEINIESEPKVYHENTIRKWIKDLCPNRAPGRRPKKKPTS